MFQQVSLKHDGWYSKLQKWTFGYVPFKNNFCPFFWLTIFCILASPFVGSFKVIVWAANKLVATLAVGILSFGTALDKMFDAIDKTICQPWYTQQLDTRVEKMTELDAYDLFGIIFGWWNNDSQVDIRYFHSDFENMRPKKRKRYLDQWNEWKKKDDQWKAKLEERRKKYIESQKEQRDARLAETIKQEEQRVMVAAALVEKATLRAKRHKAMMVALAKYTKFLVFLPAGIVGIYLLYWLGLIVLYTMENWASISNGFSAIGAFFLWFIPVVVAALLFLAAFAVVVFVAFKLIKKCALWLPPIPRPRLPWHDKLYALFVSFGLPVKKAALKVGRGFTSAVEFFAMYIKAFKENNCPAIEWKDEQ